ncbi:hypothetical protein [Streptomyces sp. A1547]|uniref:hypothetical protein n=1 Tax=Streptomyces sp. A1547 TaxID=2563105 RepID=UPI00109ECD76|nr:hypothetical protein [Streptomyces sp. A1547]THA33690.1 hypothetical protein E6W17_30765 [Streptomyces sp. A1547]
MEPISAALLLALATGAAGAAGGQSWEALVSLVRRWRAQGGPAEGMPTGGTDLVPAGPELTALQLQPTDENRAQTLSLALAARAGADAGFAAALETWHHQAQQAVPASATGNASTHISGGTQTYVITNRDVFGGMNFGQPASPPAQPGESGS